MPGRRMETRVVKEILRLKFDLGLSTRQISQSVNASVGVVHKLIGKAERAGLGWPLPKEVDDEKLEEVLYPRAEEICEGKALPEWSLIHRQLKSKGMTRQLLWEEYKEVNPQNHYSYTRFCELYNAWLKKNGKPSMRQEHKAGEKCFVDYAGVEVDIGDPQSTEAFKAQIFVGVMGASNCIFAEAAASQTLEDWLGSHTRMLEYFGGVPRIIVPDNLKSGVTKACRYDPDVNLAYQQWANHYRTVIIPARPRKPKDKSKAEVGVQIVERSVLARIRDERFFSIAELNSRIAKLVEEVNSMPFQKLPGCRREEFERVELPALGPLPPYPYVYIEIKRAKVHLDYHVEHKKAFYSVPFIYRSETVEIHSTRNIVTISFKGKTIARHKRLNRGGYSTEPAHMPESHREHEKWNPRSLRNWAEKQGSETLEWLEWQFALKDHPEQVYRVCLGLMKLSRDYPQRLNDACGVANRNGLTRLKQVREILKNGMDKLPLFEEEDDFALPQDHGNIRGADQYK